MSRRSATAIALATGLGVLALATTPQLDVSAEAENPDDVSIDCAALLDHADLAGQVTLALVSDPADRGVHPLPTHRSVRRVRDVPR